LPGAGPARRLAGLISTAPDDFAPRRWSTLATAYSKGGPMTNLRDVLEEHVGKGPVPGAVGLVAHGDRVEVQAVGSVDVEGTAPMARDSIFRIASITKPITAAAVMMLVEDGRIALDDPVGQRLPELASPSVVRTPAGPVDDVVPAARPITVADLLTFRAGYGFPSDFSWPAVGPLFSELNQGPPQPQLVAEPDAWMAALSRIPLLYQPGDAWLYNTCSDILGVLITRVSGQPLPEFLAERLFEPLGMADTGFEVPAGKLDRFTSYYRTDPAGGLELVDAPDGQWSKLPVFPSGAGGLVSTVDDWHAFARMLLAGGSVDGRRLLSPASVRQMTTDHLTQAQRDASRLFLEGQGWGMGGSVDVAALDPWNVPGRYGWVGGTGTAAYITPSTRAVTILLSQLEMTGPTAPAVMRDFWRYAAGAGPA
jgi:CubicO group peptidase (beta-lactamase class C family)